MSREIEPGLLRAFRYFALIALAYYAALILYTLLQTGGGPASIQIQWSVNFAATLVLFVYLSLPRLQGRLKALYLPIALGLSAGIPVLSNLIFLAPRATVPDLTTEPFWLLFPSLLVTVVLIAWQYSFWAVLGFAVAAAIIEEITIYPLVGRIDTQTLPILGLPLVRAFAFGLVGEIVSRMVAIQRVQRRELIRANLRLSEHTKTLEELTLSRERNRLARELHDTLAHTLSGQAVNLEAIKLMLEPGQGEVVTMLDQALKTTRDGLTEVRRAVRDLRSQPLEDLGLALAVRNLALEAAARADLRLTMTIEERLGPLEPEAEHAIYRIAQECLANVVQHSDACQLSVCLGMEKGRLRMTIWDDGKGMDLERIDVQSSHGLLGMKERAALIRGELDVESSPGQGTTIRFSREAAHD